MRPLVTAGVVLTLVLGPGAGPTGAQDDGTQEGISPRAPGAFEPAGSTQVDRFGHATAALPDGRILVVGGDVFGGSTRKVEIWDPATGSFAPTGSLANARAFPGAAALSDGRVLVFGGEGPQGLVRPAEVWDPATGEFATAGKLRKLRFWTEGVALADGRVAIVGGAGNDRYLKLIEAWDPDTDRFTKVGDLPEPRYDHTTTLLSDGRVLVVGGNTENRRRNIRAVDDALVWDPATGLVTDAGKMHKERSNHTSTLLLDGRVLVVGGNTENRTIASAEIWNPATNEFTMTGSMAQPRGSHTATALPDGRVLVVGGTDDEETYHIATEVWDPSTGEFTPSGPLLDGRHDHSADLLPDGRVLVIGGAGESGPAVRTAEVWDPGITYAQAPAASLALASCASKNDPLTSPLRERFPETLEGVAVEPIACRGRDWLALHDETDPATTATIDRAEALLGSVGRTIDDLTIATARHEPLPGQASTITALRVEGAQASRLVEPSVPLLLGIERPTEAYRSVGPDDIGVLEVGDETMPGSDSTTLYAPLGDTLWVLSVHERSLVRDIVEAVPGPGGRFDVPELGIAVTFPEDSQVSVGPEPTGGSYLGPDAIEWHIASAEPCSLTLHRPTNMPVDEALALIVEGDQVAGKLGPLDGGLYGYVGKYKFYDTKFQIGLYGIAADDAIAVLACLDRKAPEDRWRSIAESIELVPADEDRYRPLYESSEYWQMEQEWRDVEEPAEELELDPEPTLEPTPRGG